MGSDDIFAGSVLGLKARPGVEALAAFCAKAALADHAAKNLGRRKSRTVCLFKDPGYIEPHVKPDDVTKAQRADRMPISKNCSPIDVFSAGHTAFEHPHRL